MHNAVAPEAAKPLPPTEDSRTEHFDVLIVGAGLSGIGAAYHLQKDSREKLRNSRKPQRHGRNLGPFPLSRRPL